MSRRIIKNNLYQRAESGARKLFIYILYRVKNNFNINASVQAKFFVIYVLAMNINIT